jgi:hypothetical protein
MFHAVTFPLAINIDLTLWIPQAMKFSLRSEADSWNV